MVIEVDSPKFNKQVRTLGTDRLTEIRIASSSDRHFENVERNTYWHWHPNSHGNQKMLGVILESCNVIAGEGTHWIEEREVRQRSNKID